MKPRDVSEPQDEAPAASTNVRAAPGTGGAGSTGAGSTTEDVVEKLTRERDEALSDADNARSMARSRKQGKVLALIRAEKAEARVERLEAALTQARKLNDEAKAAFIRAAEMGARQVDLHDMLAGINQLGAALSSSDAPHNDPHE